MQMTCVPLYAARQLITKANAPGGMNIAWRKTQEFFMSGNKIRMVVPEGPLASNSMSP
jgi:hypothetical protein